MTTTLYKRFQYGSVNESAPILSDTHFYAKFFDGKCPYTNKPCYDWECDTCEVDAEEKKSMEELDRAERSDEECS